MSMPIDVCSMDTLLHEECNHTPLVTLALRHTHSHYDGDKSAPDCFPPPPNDQAGTHGGAFPSATTSGWFVMPSVGRRKCSLLCPGLAVHTGSKFETENMTETNMRMKIDFPALQLRRARRVRLVNFSQRQRQPIRVRPATPGSTLAMGRLRAKTVPRASPGR